MREEEEGERRKGMKREMMNRMMVRKVLTPYKLLFFIPLRVKRA